VSQVEWNVGLGLRNQNDFAAQSVRDANIVKHVRVSARAITDDDFGAVDERDRVLDHGGILPDSSVQNEPRFKAPAFGIY
jgi:hypothetical protein